MSEWAQESLDVGLDDAGLQLSGELEKDAWSVLVDELVGCGGSEEASVVEEDDLVRESVRLRVVVRGEENETASGLLSQQSSDGRSTLRIHARRRLVQQQQSNTITQ